MDQRVDLKSWSIFSLLEKDFLSSIRLACVFGNLGNNALMVTHEDEVYAIGSNCSGCLGSGDILPTLFPKKVEALCLKGVVGFAYGSGIHVLAHTSSGELYSWGHNGYYQLGNGSTYQSMEPILIQGPLLGKNVVNIACGSHHSLCLTSEGEIFAWGQNNCGQIGTGGTSNQSIPKHISDPFEGKKAISINCGHASSMAVLETGEVYAWGYNGNGQLGLGNSYNKMEPTLVISLQKVVIVKVVCGHSHTMALSDEGQLYVWGTNSYGQLGTGNKSNSCSPIRFDQGLGRTVDIAASHYNHISVAVTQVSNKCYMWGQCLGQSIITPTETSFKSPHDVFARFASPSVTHTPMVAEVDSGQSILQCLKLAFNDSTTADVKFVMEDTKEVYVHKVLLKMRCEHFRSMFKENWKENYQQAVKISQFSHVVYHAFLQYLYTGEVDISFSDAIGLLDLANSYCEQLLKKKCEALIQQGISVNNVAMLYATAIKYRAKELEKACFNFSLSHMTAVTQTEAFANLDVSILKDFIAQAALHGVFKT